MRKFHPSLPKDARILLGTQKVVQVRNLCGGDYYYFGILNCLKKHASLACSREISLQINVDGLSLFNSTQSAFWAILGIVDSSAPFVIALFYGAEKPNNLADLLKDFVLEYSNMSNGFEVNDYRFTLKLSSIICDAPARSFVKQVIGHNGKHACERCCVIGKRIGGRMVFNEIDCVLRTDDHFSAQHYDGNCKMRTL